MFLSPGKEPLSKGKSMPENHCLSSVTVGTGLANRERENKRIVEKKGVIELFEHSKTNRSASQTRPKWEIMGTVLPPGVNKGL